MKLNWRVVIQQVDPFGAGVDTFIVDKKTGKFVRFAGSLLMELHGLVSYGECK